MYYESSGSQLSRNADGVQLRPNALAGSGVVITFGTIFGAA